MHFFKKNLLFLMVFITGAAVLIIEVTATRMLAPYFGNTLFTLSSILGVILGALSLGYYIGGILADKHPKLPFFFFLIFVAGIFSLLMQGFSEGVLAILASNFNMKTGPLIASLILFFAPSLILGMMSPVAIKLKSLESEKIGQTSGNIFFWSTFGSIIGSFTAGFFLIPHFGISKIIFSMGLVLVVLGLFGGWLSKEKKYKDYFKRPGILLLLIFALSLSILDYFFISKPESIILQKDGVYSQITIEDHRKEAQTLRILRLDRPIEGGIILESDELPFEYTKYYRLYQVINPDLENVLFLGGGPYSIPRKILLEQNNVKRMDVVEIEPELYQLAKKYFKLQDDQRLFNYVGDGRRFLKDTNQDYDLIFADVYYSIWSIPVHFTTQNFFSLAKSKLSNDGFFLMNIIGTLKEGADLFLLSEIKTFKSVFKNSYFFAVNSPDTKNIQNFIFLGFRDDSQLADIGSKRLSESAEENIRTLSGKILNLEKLNLNSATVFTDDFAPVEYLVAKFL